MGTNPSPHHVVGCDILIFTNFEGLDFSALQQESKVMLMDLREKEEGVACFDWFRY